MFFNMDAMNYLLLVAILKGVSYDAVEKKQDVPNMLFYMDAINYLLL